MMFTEGRNNIAFGRHFQYMLWLGAHKTHQRELQHSAGERCTHWSKICQQFRAKWRHISVSSLRLDMNPFLCFHENHFFLMHNYYYVVLTSPNAQQKFFFSPTLVNTILGKIYHHFLFKTIFLLSLSRSVCLCSSSAWRERYFTDTKLCLSPLRHVFRAYWARRLARATERRQFKLTTFAITFSRWVYIRMMNLITHVRHKSWPHTIASVSVSEMLINIKCALFTLVGHAISLQRRNAQFRVVR